MKKNIVFFALLVVSNIFTFFFTSVNSEKEALSISQGMVGGYLIDIENNNTKMAKFLMSGFIFPSIYVLGKENTIDERYKYLCEAWSEGLDGVIRKEVFKNSTKKGEMYTAYTKGAKKLDQFCADKHSVTNSPLKQ